jgi:ubiquinone biosynthesis protein
LRTGVRTTARIQEFARVLIKYGLSEWIRALRLDRSVPGVRSLLSRRGRRAVPPGASRWELLRLAIEELGPTFVKLGQLLSNRSDLLPLELIEELSNLQDRVQPMEWKTVRESLRTELGQEISRVFRELDEVPAASASIAQVHRGVLMTGEEVAIKIQRPGIESIIETDLEIVSYLARLAERYLPAARYLGPTELVREFRKHIMRELDFTRERQNMERFRVSHRTRRGLLVPQTYPKHSTERLLIMDYVHGIKVSLLDTDEARAKLPDYDPAVVARRGADLMLEQILIHGFFHADPHPGNVMVLPGNVLCFLDFGLMGRLHETERHHLAAAISGMVRRDGARVTDAILRLTHCNRSVEYDELVEEIQDLVDDYLDRPLKDVNIAELFSALIRLVVNHGLKVPSSLLMVAKALVTIEGVGMNIYPEFTLQPALEGVARQLVIQQLRPKKLSRAGMTALIEYTNFLRGFPTEASGLVRQLRGGQLTVGFRLRGLEPLRHTLDNVGYRLVFGVVLAALLVSSALIIHAKLPPMWNGIPLIGVVGFGIAGILGLGFLFSLVVRVFRRDR